MAKGNPWTQEEQQIIILHFKTLKNKKWKQISKILSQKGYHRGEVQCRQRYVNHLNSDLDNNNQISQAQLRILYEKYEEFGPKWCLIQKFIPNRYQCQQNQRTQIKIKNVFYGKIRLFLKKLYKYFSKKTAVFINQLKKDDLQAVFDGTEQFNGLALIKKGFKKYRYKINQQNCYQMILQRQNEFFDILNKILMYKTKIKPLSHKQIHKDDKNFQIQQENMSEVRTENKQLNKQMEISDLIKKNKKEDGIKMKEAFSASGCIDDQKERKSTQTENIAFLWFSDYQFVSEKYLNFESVNQNQCHFHFVPFNYLPTTTWDVNLIPIWSTDVGTFTMHFVNGICQLKTFDEYEAEQKIQTFYQKNI